MWNCLATWDVSPRSISLRQLLVRFYLCKLWRFSVRFPICISSFWIIHDWRENDGNEEIKKPRPRWEDNALYMERNTQDISLKVKEKSSKVLFGEWPIFYMLKRVHEDLPRHFLSFSTRKSANNKLSYLFNT